MNINKLDGELEILVDYADVPTVRLRGEVDFRNMARVKQAIAGLVELGKASICVDLRELIFMDSTGISALVDAARSIAPLGGEIKLVSPSNHLAKTLSNAGFATLFRIEQVGENAILEKCPVNITRIDILEFEVPSRPEMAAHIRSRVSEFACAMQFTKEEIEDIKLAVGEASTNALRHGANPDWQCVGVKIERSDDGIKISISDKGSGFDPEMVAAPGLGDLTEGGRGIMFMRLLMDEVSFYNNNPGTRVDLIKRHSKPAVAALS